MDCLSGTCTECNPTRLLKVAMICSHPDSTLSVLKAAGLVLDDTKPEKPTLWGLTEQGIEAYFKVCFLMMLSKYRAAGCLAERPYQTLFEWVEIGGFLDVSGEEYNLVVDALKGSLQSGL